VSDDQDPGEGVKKGDVTNASKSEGKAVEESVKNTGAVSHKGSAAAGPAPARGRPARAGPARGPAQPHGGGRTGGRDGRAGRRDRRRPQRDTSEWVPKTKLGKMVKDGKITTLADALASRLQVREPEIIDILLPDLEDEVLDVNMVQRMTDSGRRVRFAVTVVVGDRNGHVGIGRAKGKEVGPTIHKAIDKAKLNITAIKRGCGSWECGCMLPHTVPFVVKGKSGSTEVTFKPCPRGIGLATGDVAKKILSLAGISDVWSVTRGQTQTTVNFAQAAFAALQQTTTIKVPSEHSEKLKIVSGGA